MARTVFALLVAVDEYAPPVPNLGGCKNDIAAVAELLGSRAGTAGDRLELRMLTDLDATRDAVVSAFREHLGQAGEGDAALFWYSGHGSQEPAPEELWHLEPDHLDETLVCSDSRTPSGRDLADKELAVLLAEVADGGADVTAVLDCCHSGSGVRGEAGGDVAVRRIDADTRPRPLASYLSGVATRSLEVEGSARRIVAMSACRSDQTAKERVLDGARRGVFSSSLVRLLAGGPVTYRDLQRGALASVANLADDQTPVLDALGAGDVDAPFLGGLATPPAQPLTLSRREDLWMLDGGRVQGVPDGAQVAVRDVAGGTLVTTGSVTTVQAVRSVVQPDDPGALVDDTTYGAVLTGVAGATGVAIDAAGDAAAAARTALAEHAALLREDPGAGLLLRGTAAGWELLEGGAPLVAAVPGDLLAGAGPAVARAAHVARWRDLLERRNPTTTIPSGTVVLDVTAEDGTGLTDADGTARVTVPGGESSAAVRVAVRNGSGYRLWCSLLGLTAGYGVISLLPAGGTWLGPGEEAWVVDTAGERRLRVTLPTAQDRTRDVLKLLVSTAEFDARALEQPELSPPGTRGGTRGFALAPAAGIAADDWRADGVVVETARA